MPYASDYLVTDVLAFADALGTQRFHLVGHDWGGFVAWAVAAKHPKQILSLTVLSTPHPEAFLHAVKTNPAQMAKSAYMLLFRAPFHAAEKLLLADDAAKLRGAYQGKVPATQVGKNIHRLQQDGCLTAALNWYRAMNLGGAVGLVEVPTLYLWSDQDMALGEAAALDTANYCKGPYRFRNSYRQVALAHRRGDGGRLAFTGRTSYDPGALALPARLPRGPAPTNL